MKNYLQQDESGLLGCRLICPLKIGLNPFLSQAVTLHGFAVAVRLAVEILTVNDDDNSDNEISCDFLIMDKVAKN